MLDKWVEKWVDKWVDKWVEKWVEKYQTSRRCSVIYLASLLLSNIFCFFWKLIINFTKKNLVRFKKT